MNWHKVAVWSIAGVCAAVMTGAIVAAQTPADVAGKLAGSWKLNRDLSPGFGAGRGRGRTGGAGARYAVSGAGFQRGGGGGGGQNASDLTPTEMDAAKAMQGYQQLSEQLKIDASATSVTFTDARGTRTYAVDDKTTKEDAGLAKISVRSKWDKGALRQEFSSTSTKVTYLWTPSADGKQLNFTIKVEDARAPREQKAVFDKQ